MHFVCSKTTLPLAVKHSKPMLCCAASRRRVDVFKARTPLRLHTRMVAYMRVVIALRQIVVAT